jgi:hypothetical protein
MSSFTTSLIVSPTDNGKDWILQKEFTYHRGSKYSKHFISVPKGYSTDFASIPQFLFFLPYWAKFNKSPIIHDFCYTSHCVTRKEADDIFLEAMLVAFRNHKSGRFIARLEYLGVRCFGWLALKGKRIK